MSHPITRAFLEKVLSRSVERFEASVGSNLGDGFTCALYKARVWLKETDGANVRGSNPLNIVIKCFPENESRQHFLDSGSLFEIELRVYDTIVPALEKFQEEALPQNNRISLPFVKLIYGNFVSPSKRKESKDPFNPLDNCLIFPDLRVPENGSFAIRDRFLGFDFDHQKLVLEAQARLHAVSWAYTVKSGQKLKDCCPQLDSKELQKLWAAFVPSTEASLNHCAELFPNQSRIQEGIQHTRKTAAAVYGLHYGLDVDTKGFTLDTIPKVPGEIMENEELWEVLLHGDCWSNNVMFRYDLKMGKPVEVIFIDLQLAQEKDLIGDVVYTLFINPEPHLRRKHQQSLLWVYFDTFTAICDTLHVPYLPQWSFPELCRRFRRASIIGGMLGADLTAILKNPDTLEDLDAAVSKGNNSTEADEGQERKAGTEGQKDPLKNLVEYFSGPSNFKNLHPAVLPRITAIYEDLINADVI